MTTVMQPAENAQETAIMPTHDLLLFCNRAGSFHGWAEPETKNGPNSGICPFVIDLLDFRTNGTIAFPPRLCLHSHRVGEGGRYIRIPRLFEVDDTGDKIKIGKAY